MAEKLFYTMGEVTEMLDVNASLIRYWGTQFPSIKPQRNRKGNRLFSPADVEQLKRIYHYVKERGMTLEGARKALKAERSTNAETNVNIELLDRLYSLQSMLIAVRDSLGEVEAVDKNASQSPSEQSQEQNQPKKPVYLEQTLFDF